MRWTKHCLTLSAVVVLHLAATPAWATDFCVVQKSADGYVALRAIPSSTGRLLVRAKAGEAVVIQKSENGDQIGNGRWLRVRLFPGSVVPQKSDPLAKGGVLGWMHSRYVGECG